MVIFPLDEQKTSLMTLMVILALSSLGFAVLGLVLGPDLALDFAPERQLELEMLRPVMPDLAGLDEFWTEAGYTVVQREQVYSVQTVLPQRSGVGSGSGKAGPGACAPRPKPGFCNSAANQRISGRRMGSSRGCGTWLYRRVWSSLPGWQDRVLAYQWQIELLNPQLRLLLRDLISVMGQPFDPEGFRKGTPESPLLALIIDDWGYFSLAADALIAYPLPLTMAVLPHLAASEQVSERIYAAGHELILHQPMEALDGGLELGPGGITRTWMLIR